MQMPDWIDSHAHLASDDVYMKANELLERAKTLGCKGIVNICTDEKTLERGLALKQTYPFLRTTAAVTPHDVEKFGDRAYGVIETAAMSGELAAIGETGLDYHYEHSPRELQKEHMVRYFKLALKTSLPLVIHCRDAFADFFALLDQEYLNFPGSQKGVLHCFTGTIQEAKEVVARGWYVSFSGIVTFKKSDALRQAAAVVPLEQLLIETDTPYLAPQSHRGKQNEPSFILETADTLAKIKNVSLEELCEKTALNASTLFNF